LPATVLLTEIKRERGARFSRKRATLNAMAAPATVSGESFVIGHWESRSREGDGEVTTREPGDLPSAVVTRENVGRGVQTSASPEYFLLRRGTSFAVTCH
jgi:hypothetical protein